MSLNIKPLEDRVVIKLVEETPKSASGFIMPESAAEKPAQGEVVAVGDGKITDNGTKIEVPVKVGDIVLYSKYGGNEIKIDGQEYIILTSRDLLAIL